MDTLLDNFVKAQLQPVMNAYSCWLGPEFHSKRTPIEGGVDNLITYSMDKGAKSYIHWMVWNVHTDDGAFKIRVEWAMHECHTLEFIRPEDATFDQCQEVVALVLKDIYEQLMAYTEREGWPSENMQIC